MGALTSHPRAEAAAARARSRWNDLGRRAVSAGLLAPVALACIWFGAGPWMGLMALAAAGLSIEWVWLCGRTPWRAPGIAVPLVVLLAGVAAALDRQAVGFGVLLAGFGLLWRLGGRLTLAAGILYVGAGSLCLMWLRNAGGDAGRANVLFLVLVVWASDIGAYAAGRLLGGPKLAPTLSPGKTWSGSAGGLIAAMLVGEAAAELLAFSAWGRAAVIAGALGVASQAGDLLESGIKRHFGVKDSGRLIPGHGGLLDRLDGLLAAAPAAAALAVMVGRGGVLWR